MILGVHLRFATLAGGANMLRSCVGKVPFGHEAPTAVLLQTSPGHPRRNTIGTRVSIFRIPIAVVWVFVTAACGWTPVGVMEPEFSGTATRLLHQDDVVSIRINQIPAPVVGSGEREVRIHPNTTLVIRERDGTYRSAGVEEIVIGAILRVKTTGVEYRSDPPLYDATWVEIVLPPPV